ncbi:MAG: DUF481 domain-containing protein [Bacteroidota bacterium]
MTLLPKLVTLVADLRAQADQIPTARRQQLAMLADYISGRETDPVRLNFICTHNSRRSHLGQIWAAVAAAYYGLERVQTFSGGTEATAFNPRAVAALERAGFRVENPGGENPHYRVHFAPDAPALVCFSKIYDDPVNPSDAFAAVMTCDHADANCPFIPGAELRLPLTYEDPKVADGTPAEAARYDERVQQIDLGGNINKNTRLVTTLKGALRLDRLGERGNVLALLDYRLVSVGKDNALNAGFAHLRYGYEPRDKWRIETFTQIQNNEQLRLNFRFLAGFGLRRRLYESEGNRAYLGVLYMYEYDELARSEIAYRDHRLSNYLTFKFPIGNNVTLASTTYYQPRLPNFTFARVSTVATLNLSITSNLRFNSSYSLTHDARVTRDLPDVPATIYSWINGLRWSF